MSVVAQQLRHAATVRNRLRFPPNAVQDRGIDLKRKDEPEIAETVADPVVVNFPPIPAQAKTDEEKLAEIERIMRDLQHKIDAVRRTYSELTGGSTRWLKIADIQTVVASHFDVTVTDIISKRRTVGLVLPRQVAQYIARTMTLKSLPEIGRRFGDRDHTTILHSIRKIEALRASDPELDEKIKTIEQALRACVEQPEETPCSSPQTQTPTAP